MATVMDTTESPLEGGYDCWPKWDRKEQIKMRYSGQEYVSKSGKVIPAKKQPGNYFLKSLRVFSVVRFGDSASAAVTQGYPVIIGLCKIVER